MCKTPYLYFPSEAENKYRWFSQIQLLKRLLGSVRGGWKLPKAETVSKTGGISVIFQKSVKNYQCALTGKSAKGGKMAPGTGMEIALQPVDRTTLEQITTLNPLRDAMLRAGRYTTKEAALLWRFQAGTDAWQTPAASEGTNTKSVCFWRTVPYEGTPMKVTHTGTVLRTAVHWKQIIWAVYKQLYHPMEGTLHWSEQGNSAGRKEQWQVWWTDLEPAIPYHPAPFMAEEEE